jgi:hypothetical protein
MLNHDPLTTTGSAPTEGRATSRKTTFSLAANYDPELVPQLASYPVDEVYGKCPTDGIGGGRPRYLATPLSDADLRSYIRLLDRNGIAFNYLLNGACFGNHEWMRRWQKRVTTLLARLGEMGVCRVGNRRAVGCSTRLTWRAGCLPERVTRPCNCFKRTPSPTSAPIRGASASTRGHLFPGETP